MTTEFISADCIYPCPMVSETERQKRLEDYRLGIWRRGCVIEKDGESTILSLIRRAKRPQL